MPRFDWGLQLGTVSSYQTWTQPSTHSAGGLQLGAYNLKAPDIEPSEH